MSCSAQRCVAHHSLGGGGGGGGGDLVFGGRGVQCVFCC